MSKGNEREQKLRYIFGQHPKTDTFHVTSDDHAFFQAGDARRHAKTLKDKSVDEVHRADVIKAKPEAQAKAPEADAKLKDKAKAPKADKE